MDDRIALQVLISAGPEDFRTAELGARLALTGASCGQAVRVFLYGAAGVWGCRRPFEGTEAGVVDLLDQLHALGGGIECCSVCAEELCRPSGPMSEWGGLREEVVPTGLVTFTNRSIEGTATLTF